ncbi:MAG: hypothetical protein IPF78_04375 [Flavobacteriales bacterium]|nr:hypothetical protein [Flavobacteriales bacterium]
MCLKELGVELPMMLGTRPLVFIWILCQGSRLYKLHLRRSALPTRIPLEAEMKALLEQDRRRRGERRPKRLLLGCCQRDPYQFFSTKLSDGGLLLHHDDLSVLGLELFVDSPQPLYDYNVLLHLKGSELREHPFGRQHRWVAHRRWSLAEQWARLTHVREESPCGCCVRVRFHFAAHGPPPGPPHPP